MAYFEQIKLADTSGNPVDAATEATLEDVKTALTVGELVEAIEALRMAVNSLTRSAGLMTFDTTSSARVRIANIDGGLTLSTVTALNSLSTYSTNSLIQDIGHFSADNLRRNITVS
jgi:hypothetical protein